MLENVLPHLIMEHELAPDLELKGGITVYSLEQ